MSRELLQTAKETARKAKKRGAQDTRISIGRSVNSVVEWRDGKLERLRESTRMGLRIELFVDGRYSGNSTSDLRPAALDRFLDDTIGAARYLSKDKHRKLPPPERYKDRFKEDLDLFDREGIKSVSPQGRKQRAGEIEAAARTPEASKHIISISTRCSDNKSESVLVCTNGMEGSKSSTAFVMSAATSVRDQGDRKPRGWWYGVRTHSSDLATPESIGKEATRRAMLMRGANQIKSGRYPCIIENACARRLLDHLMRPLYGYFLQQNRSFFADKLEEPIGSNFLDITDDPHIKRGLGSRTYDDEGMSTRKRSIFEKGRLKNFYLNTYYASKLEKSPTTGQSTNLVFVTGKKDLQKLMEKMGEGILVTGFSGGNSNTATGDFSIGVRGLLVENGQPTMPVTEMNLAGNHLKFWKKLAETGNDPYMNSSMRVPSLRFDAVQFSGK